MAINKELLAQANLTEYSDEEIRRRKKMINDLARQRKFNEAKEIECPVSAEYLDRLKGVFGIEYLIKRGVNLSRPVKKYGYEWLLTDKFNP